MFILIEPDAVKFIFVEVAVIVKFVALPLVFIGTADEPEITPVVGSNTKLLLGKDGVKVQAQFVPEGGAGVMIPVDETPVLTGTKILV